MHEMVRFKPRRISFRGCYASQIMCFYSALNHVIYLKKGMLIHFGAIVLVLILRKIVSIAISTNAMMRTI